MNFREDVEAKKLVSFKEKTIISTYSTHEFRSE